MKKLSVLLLAAIASVATTGCSIDDIIHGKGKEEPEEEEKVEVTAVVLDYYETTLIVGGHYQLQPNVLPENADQTVIFETDDRNNSIIAVDERGGIEAVGEGEACVWVFSKADKTKYTQFGVTVYEPITDFIVTFNGNGATSGSMTSQETDGDSYQVPDCDFLKDGFTFDGWALNSASGEKYNVGDIIHNISTNIVLYATWVENVVPVTNYTVTFDGNGATSGTMSQKTTTGSSYIAPECKFERNDYVFKQWALNSTTGQKYSVGSKITGIDSDIILYALWEEYTPGDYDGYYDSININSSTLLSDLRTLNMSKRNNDIGYSNMGANFKYTDYDPATVQYDSNGQPYGTRILSFYSGISTTSYNKEHVWPNSRGGGSKNGKSGSPYVEDDIYMPRPTITQENSERGNSCYVEGMNHTSNGWDPVTAFADNIGVYPSIRGECARIIFYCMTVNAKLRLVDDANLDFAGEGGRVTMGKLSDMLRWNLLNPVNEREIRRQSGGQYLQGNRNAFVDHPEYACKIWGNTNETTKQICGM